jgi:hypothetical protein
MKYFLYLMLGILVCSCIPSKQERQERRVKRFVKKYSYLIPQVTVIDTVVVRVPEIIREGGSVAGLDSTEIAELINRYTTIQDSLNNLTNTNDSIELDKRTDTRKIAKNKLLTDLKKLPFIKEPIHYDSAGVQIRIWQEGQSVRYRVKVAEQKIVVLDTDQIAQLPAPEKMTWVEMLFIRIGKVCSVIIGVTLLFGSGVVVMKFFKPI